MVPEVTTAEPGPLMVQVKLYIMSLLVWITSLNWTTTMLVMVSAYYGQQLGWLYAYTADR